MSVPRPKLRVPELRQASPQTHEAPESQPPGSKGLCLEEPGGVSEGWWRLPLVPCLPELEKISELPPRPFNTFVSMNVHFDCSSDACVEKLVSERQLCHMECPNSKVEMKSCLRSLPSQKFYSSLKAPERSFEQRLDGREIFNVTNRDKSKSEVSKPLYNTAVRDLHGNKNKNGKQYLAQRRKNSQKDNRYIKRAENPFLDVTFCKEAKSTLPEVKNRCKADSVMPSYKKENNVLTSILKISNLPNQPSLEIAIPFYFRDNSTVSIPEFPTDLNSKMSSVYLKEITKKKPDRKETYIRDFTNIYFSQNRPDAKQQTLQNDNTIVEAEHTLLQCYERDYQLFSNKNTCKRKKDLLSFNYYNHSSIKCDLRISAKSMTTILGNAKEKETDTSLNSYMLTSLEKFKSAVCNTRGILKRNWESFWIMNNYRTERENMKINVEKVSFQEILERHLLHKEGDNNTRAMNTYEQQSKPLITGPLGDQKALISLFCLNGKEENDNMLQLSYYSAQKCLRLSNGFENSSGEFLCFLKDSSGSKSMYIQTNVSETLNTMVKVNNNLVYLTEVENEFKLQEQDVFKWIVYLNYGKIVIMEHSSSYLLRILTFSCVLEDNMAPKLKKRKLSETEDVSEMFKKGISSVTSKKRCFPIFEKKNLLMDFDDLDDISLTKEISYMDNCPEGVTDVGNEVHFSSITFKNNSKSDPHFIQNDQQYISEEFDQISMYNLNSDMERKQHIMIINLHSECILEDFFNVKQLAFSRALIEICDKQNSTTSITQIPNLKNVLREIEEKKYDEILREEIKIVAQCLTNSFKVHKDGKKEKEEKHSFSSVDSMLSLSSDLLMSEKVNVEDAEQTTQILPNQKNVVDRNEFESISQENELANSKHFHLKNDSTECVNHQSKTDLCSQNNDCLQDITAKCLSTEAQTKGKDFEMRSVFDLVLQELHMFHEISKEKDVLSTVEMNSGQANYFGESNGTEKVEKESKNDLKVVTVNKRCASPLVCDMIAGPKMHKRHRSSFKWKSEPNNGEQEVPNEYYYPRTSEEELLYPTSKEDFEKPLPQRPALFPDRLKEEVCNYSQNRGGTFGIVRVHPLKTCSRPIRVGLSRKAKLKQLHPYLK